MSPALREIVTLDPRRDQQRMVLLSMRQDFPFDSTRALELALFRTYSSPRISGLLDRTGEFARAAQKRYDDTDILVSEVMEHGYDSPRGKAAIRRINQIHGRFDIDNEDYLYVLSTFVFEPIRWIERFGWRKLSDVEQVAYFEFWRNVGQRMGIRDIPAQYETFDRFNRDYERDHFRYADSNHRVGCYTREMFAAWFPRVLRPAVRRVIYAMMDEPLLDAFGFPHPSPMIRTLVSGTMRLRAMVLRLLPRRRRPVLRTSMTHRSYPDGYEVPRLGPPPAAAS